MNAAGMLALGGDGPPLQFEARDVIAAGGALRIGRRGEAWTARVPFEAVAITDVGVTPAAPSDLRMEVAGAETGRARLSGHAVFRNIFPPGPNRRPPGPAGLEVDARWANFGGALTGLDASWRPEGAWAKHLDGDLRATINGPFNAMAGSLEVEGGGTRVKAQVAHGAADLSLAFAGVETGWMLDPALRPLLGGLLHGRFHATARLWPTFAGIEAAIPDADLRLDRRRAPSGPRHFELRIGKSAPGRGGDRHALRHRHQHPAGGRDPAARRSARRLDGPLGAGRRAGGVRGAGARADQDRPRRRPGGRAPRSMRAASWRSRRWRTGSPAAR